jgi:hypothetical protein
MADHTNGMHERGILSGINQITSDHSGPENSIHRGNTQSLMEIAEDIHHLYSSHKGGKHGSELRSGIKLAKDVHDLYSGSRNRTHGSDLLPGLNAVTEDHPGSKGGMYAGDVRKGIELVKEIHNLYSDFKNGTHGSNLMAGINAIAEEIQHSNSDSRTGTRGGQNLRSSFKYSTCTGRKRALCVRISFSAAILSDEHLLIRSKSCRWVSTTRKPVIRLKDV